MFILFWVKVIVFLAHTSTTDTVSEIEFFHQNVQNDLFDISGVSSLRNPTVAHDDSGQFTANSCPSFWQTSFANAVRGICKVDEPTTVHDDLKQISRVKTVDSNKFFTPQENWFTNLITGNYSSTDEHTIILDDLAEFSPAKTDGSTNVSGSPQNSLPNDVDGNYSNYDEPTIVLDDAEQFSPAKTDGSNNFSVSPQNSLANDVTGSSSYEHTTVLDDVEEFSPYKTDGSNNVFGSPQNLLTNAVYGNYSSSGEPIIVLDDAEQFLPTDVVENDKILHRMWQLYSSATEVLIRTGLIIQTRSWPMRETFKRRLYPSVLLFHRFLIVNMKRTELMIKNLINECIERLEMTLNLLHSDYRPFATVYGFLISVYCVVRYLWRDSRRGRQLNRMAIVLERCANDADWSATGWKRVYSSLSYIRKAEGQVEDRLSELEKRLDAFVSARAEVSSIPTSASSHAPVQDTSFDVMTRLDQIEALLRQSTQNARLDNIERLLRQQPIQLDRIDSGSNAPTDQTVLGDAMLPYLQETLRKINSVQHSSSQYFAQIITCWDLIWEVFTSYNVQAMLKINARRHGLQFREPNLRHIINDNKSLWGQSHKTNEQSGHLEPLGTSSSEYSCNVEPTSTSSTSIYSGDANMLPPSPRHMTHAGAPLVSSNAVHMEPPSSYIYNQHPGNAQPANAYFYNDYCGNAHPANNSVDFV